MEQFEITYYFQYLQQFAHYIKFPNTNHCFQNIKTTYICNFEYIQFLFCIEYVYTSIHEKIFFLLLFPQKLTPPKMKIPHIKTKTSISRNKKKNYPNCFSFSLSIYLKYNQLLTRCLKSLPHL